jgi:hypothetical protein
MLHQWHMLSSSVTEEYDHAGSSECYPTPNKRLPWNKGKLIGAKPPLQPKHVWSIRTKLQIEGRAHDLAMFNLAIDNKLRGCNPAHERPLCARFDSKISKLDVHSVSVMLLAAIFTARCGRLEQNGGAWMDSRTCWIISLTIVVCFFYLYATKPSCRDGFTPVVGGGIGWYCAPGYLP